MLQAHEIRRREDGSIDIEFYRDRGLMERRQVISNTARGLARFAGPAFAVAVVALAFAQIPSRDGAREAERRVAVDTSGHIDIADPQASARLNPTVAR